MDDIAKNAKKILLLGSSFSAIPIVKSLTDRGLHVTVCGNLRSDPAHQFAQSSQYIDYSDFGAVEELVRNEHFDFVCPSCNDASYLTGAKLADLWGFPGFDLLETVNTLHEKHAFRTFAEKKGLPVPLDFTQYIENNDLTNCSLPMIIKPVDSFSGRGISKVESTEELQDALLNARAYSNGSRFVAEEFVEGQLISHSSFISNGKIALNIYADEYCTVYPYQVDSSNIPSSLNFKLKKAIEIYVQKLIDELGLVDGLLHIQLIYKEEKIWFIECTRRAPGDLYYEMVRYAYGVDGMDLYILPFIGLPIPQLVEKKFKKFIGRHTISVSEECHFYSMKIEPPAKSVGYFPLKETGGILRKAPFDKVGILFYEFNSMNEVNDTVPILKDHIRLNSLFTTKNGSNDSKRN